MYRSIFWWKWWVLPCDKIIFFLLEVGLIFAIFHHIIFRITCIFIIGRNLLHSIKILDTFWQVQFLSVACIFVLVPIYTPSLKKIRLLKIIKVVRILTFCILDCRYIRVIHYVLIGILVIPAIVELILFAAEKSALESTPSIFFLSLIICQLLFFKVIILVVFGWLLSYADA